MLYRVRFYQMEDGDKPVSTLLESLRETNSPLHRRLTEGNRKLHDSNNHGKPLTDAVHGSIGILELRVGSKDIARVFFFFRPNQESFAPMATSRNHKNLIRGRLSEPSVTKKIGSNDSPCKETNNMTSQPQSANAETELDDIDAYIATLNETELRELAVAGAALDLAIFLYRTRERKGLSQSAAAKLAGLQQQAISRLEHGDGHPRLDTIQKYLDALGYALELRAIDRKTGESLVAIPCVDEAKNSSKRVAARDAISA